MADNNQQSENNEPLENEQWKEKQWSDEQAYAQQVITRQKEEAERARLTAAQQAEAASEAEEDEGSQEDQEAEWAARLALAKGVSRTAAGPNENGAPPEDEQSEQIIKQLNALDKQIADLDKKTGSDYVTIYLFLTTGAAVVDLLQAVADATLILALLASASGITFSVVRHYGLKMANPTASSTEHQQMFRRTLISGAISMIPFVDILPEQTAFMLREWTVKKESISAAKGEIDKLKTKRKKLAASLPK